jgi:hypothetical protein
MDELRFSFWQEQEILLFSKIVQTISGVHPASYSLSTSSFFTSHNAAEA